jgi:hypothetical protein
MVGIGEEVNVVMWLGQSKLIVGKEVPVHFNNHLVFRNPKAVAICGEKPSWVYPCHHPETPYSCQSKPSQPPQ